MTKGQKGRTERCRVYRQVGCVGQFHALQNLGYILPVCVSPGTSCGEPVLLERTDLTKYGRPVLLTTM
jgi:hypothetical protein